MRRLVDDPRLMWKCCSLYYQDGLGQQEVAQALGISRPTVSRMLKNGRDSGMVRIEVASPAGTLYGEMERALEKQFGLQEVIIVQPTVTEEGTEKIVSPLGAAVFQYLLRILRAGDYVGVTMGMTLQNVVRSESVIEDPLDVTFVPVLGGVSETRYDVHSNTIAAGFAERFHATCVQFFSPAVFSSGEILEAFKTEKEVEKIYRLFSCLDAIVMGIGILEEHLSTIRKLGYIDTHTLERFKANGAEGDIALQYFDNKGNTKAFSEHNSCVAGIRIETIHNIRYRIGVTSGQEKAKAVLAAINGDFINVLITDVNCAGEILRLSETE
ncbi:sugar-binding transcriptional regulator [Selenomonas sp. TAMA-11512]|uniref:sugar-binding transcriptional regulator n=1 Tax=Selenomonas sp. TAMA-11512 TaxID=3095337 RepID=UPI003086C9E8|nr:sugar-binding transcriptional regulator [Selenomonas sp. TAMA-11512]